MVRLRLPEKALRLGVLAGFALLLLTPFVVTPGTIFPFVVGKALWSRTIIEVVFALWVVLALARPAYRPPRSWLLLLLAAGAAVALLAACFGVSVQRSLWSSYQRMQGVLDGAHWLALAVVLASVLRTAAEWRALLALNVAAGVALAGLVIARYYALDVPFYGALEESYAPRMAGPTGNPLYLSVYMLFTLMVALGFAARCCLPAAAAPASQRPGRRRRKGAARQANRPRVQWTRGLLWAAAAALLLRGLTLAASVGGFVGLIASGAVVASAGVAFARGHARRIAVAAAALLAVSVAGFGLSAIDPGRVAALRVGGAEEGHVLSVHIQRPNVQSRLATWKTGLEGFAARPLLGWGPDNFIAVFGRYASGYAAITQPHDHAHSKLIEVAATTGALGLAAWLALWVAAFLVLWRAARGLEARERALVVFAGAALFGGLVQAQFQFDTAVGSLQTILLLGFVASLEAKAVPDAFRPRLPARLSAACRALPRHGWLRVAAGVAALALAAAGLTVNQAVYAAADVQHLNAGLRHGPGSQRGMSGGIDGFRPLANSYRWGLFNDLAELWPRIRARNATRARELLEWAGREAEEVVRTEPRNWQIQQSLARMYRAAAATDPGYDMQARRYLERARELAPNRTVFPGVLLPPDDLAVRPLDDGRHELRWRWAEGAGYHALTVARGDGPARDILYAYDPARTSFIPPRPPAPGVYRYRIKACTNPVECTGWAEWPPITAPAGEPAGATQDARPAGQAPAP